jgi:hypothetical protein
MLGYAIFRDKGWWPTSEITKYVGTRNEQDQSKTVVRIDEAQPDSGCR